MHIPGNYNTIAKYGYQQPMYETDHRNVFKDARFKETEQLIEDDYYHGGNTRHTLKPKMSKYEQEQMYLGGGHSKHYMETNTLKLVSILALGDKKAQRTAKKDEGPVEVYVKRPNGVIEKLHTDVEPDFEKPKHKVVSIKQT